MKHYARVTEVGPYRVKGSNKLLYKASCECGWTYGKLFETRFSANVWVSNHVASASYVNNPIFSRWG